MSDQFTVVHDVQHLYQFAAGKSEYRCEAFDIATFSAFAYPGRNEWQFGGEARKVADLDDLASQIYQYYVGPDVTSNQNGMNKAQLLDWCHNNHIGVYDAASVLEAGNADELRLTLGAMNASGIPVSLGINDESHLFQATQQANGSWVRGPKLHNWNDVGLHHAILRIGMDMDHAVTLINDPAAACPPFQYPTPVLWEDLWACGINTAIGIMPPHVSAPPADFRFYADGKANAWPVPPPAPPDYEAIEANLKAYQEQIAQERTASDARLLSILAELAAH